MKRNSLKYIGVFVCLLPFLMHAFLVHAQEIDLTQKGTLSIEFNDKHSLVDSEYAIWHVASITQDEEGLYHYTNTEDFKTVHFKWTNEDLDYWDFEASAPLIHFVGQYIDENNLTPYDTGKVDAYNHLVFTDLPLGIYYVRQTKLGPEGYVVTPYLATIPNNQGKVNVTTNGKTDPYKEKDNPKPEKPKRPHMVHTASQILQDKNLIIGGLVLSGAACLILIKKEKDNK